MIAPAWAQTVGYYQDPEGDMRLDDVPSLNFRDAPDGVSAGYVGDDFWFEVDTGDAGHEPFSFVYVRPTFLDRIDVYVQRNGGLEKRFTLGDRVDEVKDSRNPGLFGWVVEPNDEAGPYYVRVRTQGSLQASFDVLSPDALRRAYAAKLWSGVALVTLLMVASLVALVYYRVHKQPYFLWFASSQIVYAATFTLLEGLIEPASWGLRPAGHYTDYVVPVATFLTIGFYMSVLRSFHPRPQAVWGHRVLMAASFLGFVLVVLGNTTAGLYANALSFFVVVPLSAVVAIAAWRHVLHRKRWVLLAYIILNATTFLWTVVVIGIQNPSTLSQYASLAFGFSTVLIMSALLIELERGLAKELAKSRDRLVAWQARADEIQTQRRLRYELVAALEHDVRNANGVLSMSVPWASLSETVSQRMMVAFRSVETKLAQLRAIEGGLAGANATEEAVAVSLKTHILGLLTDTGLEDRVTLTGDPALQASVRPALLTAAVLNLLDNALKYAPEGADVAVHVFRGASEAPPEPDRVESQPRACVRIRNAIERVSAPEMVRGRNDGLGTGIAISEELIRAMGGTVEVDDHDGEFGVTVCLRSVP